MLARDRMGEKPLYLYETEGRLLFASEMKALLASGLVPFELDPTAVNLYFHYQYVPEPLTPLKGVRKLDAACFLTVDVEPWQVRGTSLLAHGRRAADRRRSGHAHSRTTRNGSARS